MIDRLAQYVAMHSVSGEEAALADLIAGQLAEAGLEVHRLGNNLWAEIGDAPRRAAFEIRISTRCRPAKGGPATRGPPAVKPTGSWGWGPTTPKAA